MPPPTQAQTVTKLQKIMVQPIALIFRYLQSKTRVSVWLHELLNTRIEGLIIGFDEFMNLVIDDAKEVNLKQKTTVSLGRLLLKGDAVSLITDAVPVEASATA